MYDRPANTFSAFQVNRSTKAITPKTMRGKSVTLLIIITSLIIFLALNYRIERDKVAEACKLIPGLTKENSWHIDACYGYIYVTVPLREKYYGIHNARDGRNIGEIKSPNDVNVVNGKLYIKPVSLYYIGGDKYSFIYFDGTGGGRFDADDIEKLPKYLVINPMTGAITPYATFEDIPENERVNFKER